ncbi:hypothetical protein Tco_1285371 [Tanacetum coccineum]
MSKTNQRTLVGRGCGGGGAWVGTKGRCVAASGVGDRIDRLMRFIFDLGRKSPPEKFSGGGAAVVAGGWPDPAAGEMGEREGVVKLPPVLEEEPAVKPKRAKRPAKKSTIVPTTSVVIRDTPSESVPKKKTPVKVDRGKDMDLLSNVALLEAVPDEQEDKTTGTDEGTGTKPGVLNVPKYLCESENESWGDSGDDERNDDDSDEVTKDDDDDVDSDVEDDKEASDSKKTDSDEDENPNLNQNDDEEEEYEEEYVRNLDRVEFTDDEEYEELYKDVNIRLQATEHEEEEKEDEEMTDAGHDEGT